MSKQLTYTSDQLSRLRASVNRFGFGSIENALIPSSLNALVAEAEARFGEAVGAERTDDLKYRGRLVSLGPVALGLLRAPDARELLLEVFGDELQLSEGVSCLTFYSEGDHLGPHLDQPVNQCAVTIIIYLSASSPAPESSDTGLVLRVYGETITPNADARLSIPTRAGSIVVGRGSKIWHERPALKQGERVVAITGCFALTHERHADSVPADPSPFGAHVAG